MWSGFVKYIWALGAALLLYGWSVPAGAAGPLNWTALEPGVESCAFSLSSLSYRGGGISQADIVALRLNPAKVDFELLMASEHGEARTLDDWSRQYDLLAAINASMYLPDGRTSTGYMRRAAHANNSRVVNSFGAFFVARPDSTELPRAAVLDRYRDNWEEMLPHYQIVVQNYRLMSPEGAPLWNGSKGPFSIAAVGQDVNGNILFLHSAQPVTVKAFVEGVLAAPLGIERLMYVEGGRQAAMLVNTASCKEVWTGKYSPLLQLGGLSLLPNVLGVKRRPKPGRAVLRD